ncbi:type II secretion system minor pseudopilin GspJ [Endozoicomonas numazuensis]|uniref:type II secretion system minor pseudopilin GspJ n=1 Tax=Endozoicomonas numazuensis TaxID=1137799 RepID=UPI00068C7601|nr:type II secretion system minor pseudopilin GspJ [Endozoicomonas numazuensis]
MKPQGFTLIELLIALFIFSLISGAAYRLLVSVSQSHQATEHVLSQMAQGQKARLILENDFSQLSPRAIRDAYGERQPALISMPQSDYLVEFTRAGWQNPLNQPRSSMQRVAYQLVNGELHRLYWQWLDRAPSAQVKNQVLMTGVSQVSLRFLDQQQQWHQQWSSDHAGQAALRAVEMALTFQDQRTQIMTFAVTSGTLPVQEST